MKESQYEVHCPLWISGACPPRTLWRAEKNVPHKCLPGSRRRAPCPIGPHPSLTQGHGHHWWRAVRSLTLPGLAMYKANSGIPGALVHKTRQKGWEVSCVKLLPNSNGFRKRWAETMWGRGQEMSSASNWIPRPNRIYLVVYWPRTSSIFVLLGLLLWLSEFANVIESQIF